MKTKILGGEIIAFDGKKHVLIDQGEIIYEENQIIFVGESYPGKVDRTIDVRPKLIIPGLINVHTHSLTAPLLYRGITEDEGPVLYKYLLPVRYGTPSSPPYARGEDAYLLSRLTILDILRSGVTTVFEQTDNLEDPIKAAQDLGIRFYGCHSYFNSMPFEKAGTVIYPPPKDSCPGFDENLRLIKEYQNACNGRIKVWLGPHAADTCSPELLQETRKKADELKVGIGTHISQSMTEVNEIKRRVNKTPVAYLADMNFWGKDVIAAHAIHTTSSDVAIMARDGMNVAHCASSYVKSGIHAPMARYRKNGINVVLGTDQNPMDLLDEMRLAMFSSKLNEDDPNATTVMDVFNSVTLGAARALGREDIGRIAPGAKADLVVVNTKQTHLCPHRDPLKALIYHANRNDVEMMIVDGKILMEGRKILTVDEEEIVSKANEVAHRIWRKVEAEIGLPKLLLEKVRKV
ncbi:MAG: amidohydrolase family protein [Deltaproteobacteria bacterium]|nr:amidohydrolase family protein [Deltaproteobacteria bacterium]